MIDENEFAPELEAIRKTYRSFHERRLQNTLWAPLEARESQWRVRQLAVFSQALLAHGWNSLSGRKTLDFGCGRGRHLRQFIDMGAEPEDLDGIDLDSASVEEGRRLSPNLRIALSEGVRLPYPDESFDLVTQFVVFSSIPSQSLRNEIASEIDRVIRPGGLLFWWDMNHMAADAGGQQALLRPEIHFAKYSGRVTGVAQFPPPSASLRPLRGLGPILGRFLDRFGYRSSHHAALLRKPERITS